MWPGFQLGADLIRARIDVYNQEVEQWKQDHDAVADDCWFWMDKIDDANHLFKRIMRFDLMAHRRVLSQASSQADTKLLEAIPKLIQDWLGFARKTYGKAERLAASMVILRAPQSCKRTSRKPN